MVFLFFKIHLYDKYLTLSQCHSSRPFNEYRRAVYSQALDKLKESNDS
jgi:hypothetical protein